MRKFLSLAICLIMTLCSGCALFTAHKSLIEVNGEKISQKDFDDAYNAEVKNSILTQANVDLNAPENKFLYLTQKNNVVNKLIINKIIDQELKKHQIKVSNDEVQKELDFIYKSAGSKEIFEKILKAQGINKSLLKKEIKRGVSINKLISKIAPEPKISDDTVKKFYEERKQENFYMPKMVRASHILIIANKEDLKQEYKKQDKNLSDFDAEEKATKKMSELKIKANSILKKAINAPDNFKALVKEYSQDIMTNKKDGDLNFFEFGQRPKQLCDAAFSIKPGTVYSKIVQTDSGYHIIKVTDRREEGLLPFDEVKDEIKMSLIEDKKALAFEKYMESKLKKADVKFKDPSYDPKNIEAELKEIMMNFTQNQEKQKAGNKVEAKK